MLTGLELPRVPRLLVGLERPDDAGVYQLSHELGLVQTVDFFTPIVDDPFAFGQIAAANALSDVYAMGGRPLCAMNVLCYPLKELGPEVLGEILAGGLEKLREAGVALVGGHSVDDRQLKYGLSVTGIVHPRAVLASGGCEAGDRLVLTKAIGTGVVATALKRGLASEEAIAAAIRSMCRLNRVDAEVLRAAHACTDVTGFGLIGHLAEMIEGTTTSAVIDVDAVPLLPRARDHCAAGIAPAGSGRNKAFRGPMVDGAETVARELVDLLYDPQTSGGLLLSLPGGEADRVVVTLRQQGIEEAAVIGEVLADPGGARICLR